MRKNLKNADKFLADYKESAEFMMDENNLDTAAALTVKFGIIPNEAAAKAAIGKCGLTFVTGRSMKDLLDPYLAVMLDADPASVGGKIPDGDFYYEAD